MTHSRIQLVLRPEPSTGCLRSRWRRFAVKCRNKHINQFSLYIALIHIFAKQTGHILIGTQAYLLIYLARQRLADSLTIVHMSACGCIPFSRLHLLPWGTALQIKSTITIEHMKMHYRMQALRPTMSLRTCHTAKHSTILVNYGEQLLA